MSPLYTVLMLLLVAPMEALVVGTAPRTGLVRASAARMDTPPPPGKGSRLGGTVDQDGKSNVWAVEPQMAALDHGIAALQALASEAHQDVNEELAEAQQRLKGVHAAVQSFQERWLASFLPGADLPAAVPGDGAAL